MAVKSGKSIRFEEEKVRSMGRTAAGVRGIRLPSEKDEVVGMICINDLESNVLVVSENGYGKRSDVEDYRITNRGGKGVKTINITEKTGSLIALKNVTDSDDLMVINKSGITIRIAVDTLRVMGRATQGVKIIKLRDEDSIASVAKVSKWGAEEEMLLDEDGNVIEPVVSESAKNEDTITNETSTKDNTEDNTNEKNEKNEDN
jgi:DNA gyrase subunit A